MRTKFLCYLFYAFTRLLYATYRFRYFGLEHYLAATKHHPLGAFCLASWHEHALGGTLSQKGLPYCILVSPSRDGELVAFYGKKLGYSTARGSSSRGGKEARVQLEEKLSQGVPAAFTVDGPRGPRGKAKPGILATAKKTNTAILPIVGLSAHPWVLAKTWDQTKIPRPFSKIVCQFGPPIFVPSDLSDEDFEANLTLVNEQLNATETLAQRNLEFWDLGEKKMPYASHGEAVSSSKKNLFSDFS